jgi:transposase
MGQLELTKEEIEKLKKIHKYTRNNTLKENRIKVVLAFDNGKSKEEIRDILLLDLKTIRRYINDFKQYRMDSIEFNDKRKDRNNKDNKKLTNEQLKQVEEYVNSNIINDSKIVKEYIKNNFQIEYSDSAILNILHSLGFTYKKVTLVPQKSNSKEQIEKQVNFEKSYEKLVNELSKDDKIYFFDAEHPTHNTKVDYAWIKKGETKEIEANSGRQRLNICGCYSPITSEVLINYEESVNANSVINMFDTLLANNKSNNGYIYIVLDNAKYNKSKIVQDALKSEKYSRIKLIFLPPYSPNLNLIERLWKFTNKQIRNNIFYDTFNDFKKAFEEFFDTTIKLDHIKEKLKQFISDKFHIPNRDLIKPELITPQGFVFNDFVNKKN